MSDFKVSVTELYVGYFGRAPEPVGLSFWLDALEGGFSVVAAAQDFAGQAETLAQYPYMANPSTEDLETFLDAVYQNLFGRSTDAAGLAFWSGQIENGLPLGTAILDIIGGAVPADRAILDNKVALACQWHDFAEVEPDFALTADAVASSQAALALVTSDPASIAPTSVAYQTAELFFNDAPVLSVTPVIGGLAEDADTSARTKVADIVVTDDGLGTNDLRLAGADAGLFELEGDTLYLKAGVALDHETAASFEVRVELDDPVLGAGVEGSVVVPFAIADVNEAPGLSVSAVVTALAEGADTASRIKVADIAVSDDALGTNTLSLAGDDAGLFEIDGTELYLRAGTVLDFATNPSLDVSVVLDDAALGTGAEDSAALQIAVTDVNAPPTLTLTGTTTSLSEGVDLSARLKVADIAVMDDALGTNVLSLSGADAGLFEIDGAALYLRAGAALDFETNATLDVTVEVEDADVGASPDDSASLQISLSDANDAPALSVTAVVSGLDEDTDTASRIKVADLVISDDALGSAVITLSGADAGLFEVDGTEVFLKAGTVLDFEDTPSLNVTVNVDDPALGTGPEASVPLSLALGDVNEAPSLLLVPGITSFAEDANTSGRFKVADIVVTDDALGSNTLSLTGDDAALFEIDGTEVYLKAGATLDFETNPSLDVTVEVDDATLGAAPDDSASLSLAVSDVNEAPVLSVTAVLNSLAEDTSTAARIKVADIAVSDDALGTNALSLAGDDAALFEIDGSELFLKAGTVLDFETDAQLDVTVLLDDPALGTGFEDSAALSLAITDTNSRLS